MRHAALRDFARAQPAELWPQGRRHRPARPVRPAYPANLVPLGIAVVDGHQRRREGRTGLAQARRATARSRYSIGSPAWVLRESSEVKLLCNDGIATSAINSGVQPPLWWTMRTGRMWP